MGALAQETQRAIVKIHTGNIKKKVLTLEIKISSLCTYEREQKRKCAHIEISHTSGGSNERWRISTNERNEQTNERLNGQVKPTHTHTHINDTPEWRVRNSNWEKRVCTKMNKRIRKNDKINSRSLTKKTTHAWNGQSWHSKSRRTMSYCLEYLSLYALRLLRSYESVCVCVFFARCECWNFE